MTDCPLIVNATAIGARVDGIRTYGVHLLKALWASWRTDLDRLTVVLNEEARHVIDTSDVPDGAQMHWVSARVSPSRGTSGNVARWIFANHLARRHPDAVVLALSQLEAPVVGSRGIVMVHDMVPWLFPSAHPRQYYFFRRCLGHALSRAAAVLTPSQATKDDVCKYYGLDACRVHVISHGSPLPIRETAGGSLPGSVRRDRGRDRYILWIGRSDPTKNLAALLTAFQRIERQVDARLVIAGEAPSADLHVAGVDRHDLGRVTVLGPVSEKEKLALLDGASVLACPSLYEGFGFAPLEAMARGCPVVAARTGALPEVCGDAAIYIDPARPIELAEALRRVLTHSDLARSLAARGRLRAAALTWEASVRRHLEIIERASRIVDRAASRAAGSGGGAREADALP